MSKLIKITVILVVAAVAIAAKQVAPPTNDMDALAMAQAPSVSPAEIMHRAGPLPELVIENLI
jgi:hypothetical protein